MRSVIKKHTMVPMPTPGGSILHPTKPCAWFLTVCLILVSIGLVGCSDDDPIIPDTGDTTLYIWPDTPDKLMINFELAYSEMNITEYENCLHPDFQFKFTNNDIWERADDVNSTTNMFAGNSGEDSQGSPRMGVKSIEISQFTQELDWDTTLPNHPVFPSSEKALYKVTIRFFLENDYNTITISSQQLFYVMPEEVDKGNGTTQTRFFLYGQQDLEGEGKGNEDMTWGGVKALY